MLLFQMTLLGKSFCKHHNYSSTLCSPKMYQDLHWVLRASQHGPPPCLRVWLFLTCFPTNQTCALHILPVSCIVSSRMRKTEDRGIKGLLPHCIWTGLPGLPGFPRSIFLVLRYMSKSRVVGWDVPHPFIFSPPPKLSLVKFLNLHFFCLYNCL